jgi:hypothetical protein
MSRAENHLTIARLHIGVAIEKSRKAWDASRMVGEEHAAGQSVVVYTESHVLAALDEAQNSLLIAHYHARQAREATAVARAAEIAQTISSSSAVNGGAA